MSRVVLVLGVCCSILRGICLAGDLADYRMVVATFRTGDTELFVVDPDFGDARNLSRSPKSSERYPSLSPDGTQVAFNSDRDGTFNLYLINADGTNVRQLTHEKPPVVAGMQSWTADGRWIYFGLFGGDHLECAVSTRTDRDSRSWERGLTRRSHQMARRSCSPANCPKGTASLL